MSAVLVLNADCGPLHRSASGTPSGRADLGGTRSIKTRSVGRHGGRPADRLHRRILDAGAGHAAVPGTGVQRRRTALR